MAVSEQENATLPVIGWREWVQLPELKIPSIKAKIDSGARSSALHVVGLEEFERDGEPWVRFQVPPNQHRDTPLIKAESKVFDRRSVRSSSGASTVRYFILTTIVLHGLKYEVEMTLASRHRMKFRMLLGREAFRNRFLVDASRSFLAGKHRPTHHPHRKAETRKDSSS